MRKKIIIPLILVIGILAIPITTLAYTIQVITVNYTVETLKTATSDAAKVDYDNMQYVSSWSQVYTDMDNGYYTTITTQKKVAFVYTNKDVLKVMTPNTSSTVTRTVNGIGSGTYRYKIYNYSMNSKGTLSINFREEKYAV